MGDWLREAAKAVDQGLLALDRAAQHPKVKELVGATVDATIEGAGRVAHGTINQLKERDNTAPAKPDETPRPMVPNGATHRAPDRAPERSGKENPVATGAAAGDWPKIGATNRTYAPTNGAVSRRPVVLRTQGNDGEPVRVREEAMAKPSPYAEGALVTEKLPGRRDQDVSPPNPSLSPPLDESDQYDRDYEQAVKEELKLIQEENLKAEIEKREMSDLLKELKDAEQRLNALLAEQAQMEADEKARRAATAAATAQKEKKAPPKKTSKDDRKVEKPAATTAPPPEKVKKAVEVTKRQLEELKQKEQQQKARVAATEAAKARPPIHTPNAARVTMPAEPLLLRQSDRVAVNIVKNLLAYEGVPKPVPDENRAQQQLKALAKRGITFTDKQIAAQKEQRRVATQLRRNKSPEQMRTEWAETIVKVARETRLDPLLILAVMKSESDFQEWVVSTANAYGLIQLLPCAVEDANRTHPEDRVTWEQVRSNPSVNLMTGIRYLALQRDRFHHDLELIMLAYNVGPTRVQAVLNAGKVALGNESKFKHPPKGPLRPLQEAMNDGTVTKLVARHADLNKSKLTYTNNIATKLSEYTRQTQHALSFVPKT